MTQRSLYRCTVVVILTVFSAGLLFAQQQDDIARYVRAVLGDTPVREDLRELCDVIGGRATGSESNRASIEWGMRKFKQAGVSASRDPYTMPGLWLERSSRAVVSGALAFEPRIVAMPFSVGTMPGGVMGELINVGKGTTEDFKWASSFIAGKFILVETEELKDIDGLFKEYADAAEIEHRAYDAGVKGIVYMGSRPELTLYRHNASRGFMNTLPMVTMARLDAQRCARALRAGAKLMITLFLDVNTGGPYQADNVIAEIAGRDKKDEIVIIGAHIDSWDLGTGANDNGCNVAMMIDLARQMKKAGIVPRRTVRFALWNGEEQGMYGSMGYTVSHSKELSNHVMAMSIDIGSGRINGFFTGGRPDVLKLTEELLKPVAGLGPFTNIDAPIVGTDNFDFMMHGIGNLVANQEPQVYGPTYHAQTDTYDKVDFQTLKTNEAVAAALVLGYANAEVIPYKRQTRAEIEALVGATDLEAQMRMFGIWDSWDRGERGRAK